MPILLGLVALCGCVEPPWQTIPRARTSPPPKTFGPWGSFAWRAAWAMAQDDLARRVARNRQEGFTLHDLEVCRDEGATRFAAVWLKDPRAGCSRWRYTRRQFDRDFRTLRDKGCQPMDLEIINEHGTLRYSAAWSENPGGPAWGMR